MTPDTYEMELLRLKVALLTQGVRIPDHEVSRREGGAGPTLGRYFLLNDTIVVNAPVHAGEKADHFNALTLKLVSGNRYRIIDAPTSINEVQLLPLPQFYSEQLSDGTPMSHIARIHGTDCLATTIVQHCDYFTNGTQCKFCSIPLSLTLKRTVRRKTPEQFLAVLHAAQREGLASHITLTMGSPARPDRGATDYIAFVSKLRRETSLPIHAQLEPPTSPQVLEQLHDAGVDTLGIHIEAFDEKVRQTYCPGKYQYASYADYRRAWREAVQVFGRGQVSSFILLGLGDTPETLHHGFEDCIKLSVIPVPVPCRPNPGSQLEDFIPNYIGQLDQTVQIYLDCAKLLRDNKLDPTMHKAGCITCGGCTALIEAFRAVDSTKKR